LCLSSGRCRFQRPRDASSSLGNRGIYLLEPQNIDPEQQNFLNRKTFETGQVVPQSGVYSVVHAEHRLPHEVTLLRADTFPPCSKCGVHVKFKLLRSVSVESFQVVLNSLPEVTSIEDIDIEKVG
jgi:hypothetical protein